MDNIATEEEFRRIWEKLPKPLGLVPTMGSLHAGHISLLRRARVENKTLVASLFVNPTQFGVGEDFKEYPRDTESDLAILESEGVDLVFIPTQSDMYPDGFVSSVNVGDLGDILEGQFRPGHFSGVATVVSKLLSICRPDRSYFGQKDAQQCAVIKRLVLDLNLGSEIVICPTIRNEDGIALSSRNIYLSPADYDSAKLLSESLFHVKSLWMANEVSVEEMRQAISSVLDSDEKIQVEYISFNDVDTFVELSDRKNKMIVCIAARIGYTRLIDNIILD